MDIESVKSAMQITNAMGYAEAQAKLLKEERDYLRERVKFLEQELAKHADAVARVVA